jgi:hypothetical protein
MTPNTTTARHFHAVDMPPPLFLTVHKARPDERLGVAFGSEGLAGGGALVHRVCYGGVAWRSGLRTGDVVTSITLLTAANNVRDGFEAARLLRDVRGECCLRVLRRKKEAACGPAAAACIQAAARAWLARLDVRDMRDMRDMHAAAASIQAAFSGFVLRVNLEVLRTAATSVQRHWRGCDARLDLWSALFAVETIQRAARRRTDHLRRAKAARPHRPPRIRSPATLFECE